MLAWLTSWVRVVPCIPQKGHHARAGAARPTQIIRAISGRRILVRRPVIGGSPCASEAAWGRAGEWAEPCRNLAVLCPYEGDQSKPFPAEARAKTGVVVLHNKTEPTRPRSVGIGVLGAVDDLDKLVGRVLLVGCDDQGADVLVPRV